ncbi:MAG: ABC transporter permease [Phycisphaerales bacterium]
MLTQVLAIARNTFVESIRQPIVFVLVMASGVAQVFNSMLSNYSMGYSMVEGEVTGDDKMFLDIGLATVMGCATLLAAFIATAVISREIEQKTALTVISKPIGRPLFVVGKFLGVAGAMTAATAVMLAFFLFTLQHGVMSRAYDDPDRPVQIIAISSVVLALGIALWGNYFYGWVFTSAAMYGMIPLTVLGLIVTLFFDEKWRFHENVADLFKDEVKPGVLLACAAVWMAMLVLTAVAVAASTRMKQVMTILLCFGVFVFGLLSNHFIGRRAFQNTPAGTVITAEPIADVNGNLRESGDVWRVELKAESRVNFAPGDSVYYAGDPSGIEMVTPAHEKFVGDVNQPSNLSEPSSGPALVVRSVEERRVFTIVNAGDLWVDRPPQEGDYLFGGPTRVNWGARAAWSVAPNMQFFWLVDAITQNHPIPPRYALLLLGYTGAHVMGFLALAVMLFQNREVG